MTTTTPHEFCEKMIAEWQTKSKQASENADLKAFEFAQREIRNYQEMLKKYLH